MKKFLFCFVIIISTISCREKNLPKIIDNFVDDVELSCGSYSTEDWEASCTEFKILTEEYASSDWQYTEAEKQLVARAIGRFDALLLKQEIVDGAAYINELVKRFPEYIDGLTDGLLNGLREEDNTTSQESDLPKSFEELGRAIDQLFEK